ncbi:MAG: VWA domain-containing protein, partial [Acidobacteriaceae bacterium]|nr:VWA domain-containing protein [Acidobacteriaceae bacterium]
MAIKYDRRHGVRYLLTLLVVLASFPSGRARAQTDTITVHSNLVLVPALVKTHDGQRIYELTAGDFTLLDNGVRQTLHLQEDTGGEPLALAVVVQTGGRAAAHLQDYQSIELLLEDIIGEVPHTVAVISFDSAPRLEQGFSEDIPKAASAINRLEPGDDGAAILDAVAFGVQQLQAQPLRYRRAILLISETFDDGSKISLDDAVRAVGDNNTIIYSLAFSSGRAIAAHHAAKLPVPNHGTEYSQTPYEHGGCMSRDPDADPDAHGSRAKQALHCAGDLLPPLRLAQLAFDAAKDGL